MSLENNDIRAQFPVFANKTYINSCSYGALSLRVQAAFQEYLEVRAQEGSRWDLWVGKLEELRALLARLLGAAADDCAITSSVSEAVNSLASAFDFAGGRDTVVVTDFDFPTTSQIWLAQQRRGARVLRARADESGTHIPLAEFDQLIDARTALVSVPWVCYRNGARLDPAPIIELAHARGARVLVDAYQALGTFPVDVQALGADFLTGGSLKYLLGTAGIGFLHVRESAAAELEPTSSGWFAQADIGAMDIHHHRPAPNARRFEAGTPNVPGLYGAAAGLELLLEIGVSAAEAQITRLTDALIAGVRERGWQLATPAAHGALLGIRSSDAPQLVERLAAADIVVSDRDGNLRISPHVYNVPADIDRLFEQLDRNAELLEAPAAPRTG